MKSKNKIAIGFGMVLVAAVFLVATDTIYLPTNHGLTSVTNNDVNMKNIPAAKDVVKDKNGGFILK